MMIMCTFSGVAGLSAYKVDMISQACIGSCDTRLWFLPLIPVERTLAGNLWPHCETLPDRSLSFIMSWLSAYLHLS